MSDQGTVSYIVGFPQQETLNSWDNPPRFPEIENLVVFKNFCAGLGRQSNNLEQLLVADFSWIIGYFTRSAFTIRAIGGSEFYKIFPISDHPLIYSEHQVSVERKSDLIRTSAIGYPGPVVRVSLRDG